MASDVITYPYGPPTVSGTTVTADFLTKDPRRITRAIADIALQKFMVDKIFAPAGEIVGGAVQYEQATANELYAARDVGQVEPGTEFPIITFERGVPLTAQVEKFGGKFDVTDEAVRRNRVGRVNRSINQLANTIVRKTQQRAITELDAAIVAASRTATGTSWSDDAATALQSKVATIGLLADLTAVEKANEVAELGYDYDFAIMNPQEWRNARLSLGGTGATAADVRALFADSGITGIWVTNRQTAGKVKWLAQRMVGEIGYEVPLSTETWRDKDGKQKTWFQSYVLPIMYVTDPYAILETDGHAA